MDNKKYVYLTKQVIDKCGGIEAIQNWYKKCGIIVVVLLLMPVEYDIKTYYDKYDHVIMVEYNKGEKQ